MPEDIDQDDLEAVASTVHEGVLSFMNEFDTVLDGVEPLTGQQLENAR